VLLKDCLDSAGNVLADNGNGKWIEYRNDFKTSFAEGVVINGFANGEWHGRLSDTVKYVCNYTNGQLKEGKSYGISGKEYPFNKIFVTPEFKGGLNPFAAFLAKTLRYPADAINKKIQGRVYVRFIVEKDGSLSDIRLFESVYPSIDNEALNAIARSPNWTACYIYGIISKITYTVPISFTLADH
jgi:TonB family protein